MEIVTIALGVALGTLMAYFWEKRKNRKMIQKALSESSVGQDEREKSPE